MATSRRVLQRVDGLVPPVDNLKLVTPYPKAQATMKDSTLAILSAGKPVVLHLYTG
jgi:hypothetical protein